MIFSGEIKTNTVEAQGEYHRSLLKADIRAEMKDVVILRNNLTTN